MLLGPVSGFHSLNVKLFLIPLTQPRYSPVKARVCWQADFQSTEGGEGESFE